MDKYPKTMCLFKRDAEGQMIEGKLTTDAFANIKSWLVTEKIDGTNIRIRYEAISNSVRFGTRSTWEEQHIPKKLLPKLKEWFTVESFEKVFGYGETLDIILYGEGYGAGIQSGAEYSKEQKFVLFDVHMEFWNNDTNKHEGVWLEIDSVIDIASQFGVELLPILDKQMTLEDIREYVASRPISELAESDDLIIEGVVARTHPMLCFRSGSQVKFKWRVSDVENLEKQKETT